MRWICPDCGSEKNGPERPRTDDVRRYCLPCSESTGRLVKRTAPVLEARRAAGAARSAKKARRKAEREKADRTIHGVNVDAEARMLIRRSATLRAGLRRQRNEPPIIDLKGRPSRTGSVAAGRQGVAWSREGRVVLYRSRHESAEQVRDTLLHELVHLALPHYVHHGPEFHKMLVQTAWEGYGVSIRRGTRFTGQVARALAGA